MRISLVIAAVSAIALSGCCCEQRCSPCAPQQQQAQPKPKAKPCVTRYTPAPACSPCTAPKLTPPPALASTPIRLAFPVPPPTTSSYASAWNRPAPIARTTAPIVARPSAPVAASALAPVSRPAAPPAILYTKPAGVQAIIAPPEHASMGPCEDGEECPGGVCGVPPPPR